MPPRTFCCSRHVKRASQRLRELTEVIVRIVVAVVVVPEGAEAALDPDRAGAQEGVGRLAQPQATHLVVHD